MGRLASDDKRCREDAAAPAFAAFAAATVVCRLVGELLRRRLTEGVLMTGGSLTAAAAGLMLCFCENPVFCLAAFALPGAGLSPVVPLLFSRAGRLDGVSSAAAASLIAVPRTIRPPAGAVRFAYGVTLRENNSPIPNLL